MGPEWDGRFAPGDVPSRGVKAVSILAARRMKWSCFSVAVQVAVEPRHSSWWDADRELRAALERHGSALCRADRGSRPVTRLWRTASWGYVRFHGGTAEPPPR